MATKLAAMPKAASPRETPRSVLAAKLVKHCPRAELSWKFGNASLVIDDKVFAFPSKNTTGLVMKLPEADIPALLETGNIRPLVMGKRTMREWVVADDATAPETLKLLRSALAYVASLPKTVSKARKPQATKTRKP
jgi:hypothetical protein